ncbi:MAG: AAA family ATPase [Staphylothermus sp.]|nr:AAA family ATPase [Staphylothermus sp.]
MITGNRYIDEVIGEGKTILFYGVAGSGKTTMLMMIASNICRNTTDKCLYISTEETLHYERVAKNTLRFANVWFMEIYDFDELLDFALLKLPYIPLKHVFVDSINSLYRVISYEEESITKYGLLLATLRHKVRETGGKLFASAQVRVGYEEDEEELTASGMNILNYWFDVIIFLSWKDNGRVARLVKPTDKEKEALFEITDEGVEWINEQ